MLVLFFYVCYYLHKKEGDTMSFGSRLKEARKKSGLTQAEVAEKLNVSASMIAQYETGKRNPKKETLSK